MRIGAYPGTFDPPTVAHLAIAEAARRQGGLDAVALVVSRSPLGKAPVVPTLEDRLAVLAEVAATRPWLSVAVTDQRLIADVAAGYDAVVMGTDKWQQVLDPAWYGGSEDARDRALRALPPVLLADRPAGGGSDRDRGPVPAPPPYVRVTVLDVHADHGPVSSTLARGGRIEWMLPEAARFDALTGAWSDPGRYRRSRGPGGGAAAGGPGGAGRSGGAGSSGGAAPVSGAATSLPPMRRPPTGTGPLPG